MGSDGTPTTTGRVMQHSNLGCQKWGMAICLMLVNRTGISSIKMGECLQVHGRRANA